MHNDEQIDYVEQDAKEEEPADVLPRLQDYGSPPCSRFAHEGREKWRPAIASIPASSSNRQKRSHQGLKHETKLQRTVVPAHQFLPVPHQPLFHCIGLPSILESSKAVIASTVSPVCAVTTFCYPVHSLAVALRVNLYLRFLRCILRSGPQDLGFVRPKVCRQCLFVAPLLGEQQHVAGREDRAVLSGSSAFNSSGFLQTIPRFVGIERNALAGSDYDRFSGGPSMWAEKNVPSPRVSSIESGRTDFFDGAPPTP